MATPTGPLPGRDAQASASKKRRGSDMTDGEIAYLSMVLVLFVAFLAVIGAAMLTQDERRNE